MARENTNKLIDYIDQGLLSRETVLNACLSYMSEDDVTDMVDANYFFEVE